MHSTQLPRGSTARGVEKATIPSGCNDIGCEKRVLKTVDSVIASGTDLGPRSNDNHFVELRNLFVAHHVEEMSDTPPSREIWNTNDNHLRITEKCRIELRDNKG